MKTWKVINAAWEKATTCLGCDPLDAGKRLKKSHNPVEKALPRHLQRIIGRTLGLLDARERGGTERGEKEGREKGERGS